MICLKKFTHRFNRHHLNCLMMKIMTLLRSLTRSVMDGFTKRLVSVLDCQFKTITHAWFFSVLLFALGAFKTFNACLLYVRFSQLVTFFFLYMARVVGTKIGNGDGLLSVTIAFTISRSRTTRSQRALFRLKTCWLEKTQSNLPLRIPIYDNKQEHSVTPDLHFF